VPLAVLKMDNLYNAGLPQLEELAAAMKVFQAKGKPIYAYSADFSQAGYFAAAQADEVLIDPMGGVFLEGFGVYTNYFKEALDKLGVNVHVFRVGEYKSAVEPFLRNDMSPEAKAANQEWLGDLWGDYVDTVGQARKLGEGATDSYISGYSEGLLRNKGDSAAYAKEAGLITGAVTLAEFRKKIGEKVGFDDDHGSFRQINYIDYLHATRHQSRKQAPSSDGKLALVVVQGEIVDGGGEPGEAGGETIADLLDEARRDEDVKAVVLRVDSPGGSVWASEQIRRAVQALRADGKPVVASMSSVAASGGYWVSMDADEIWAHNSTITGSIGIFGLVPTIEKPLEKLGIRTDGVGTTPLTGAFRLDRPLTPMVQTIIQAQIDMGYREFIEGVAEGRDLAIDKVDQIARGRVWSGQHAKELGLVDHIGGLEDAAAAAAKLSGLDPQNYELEEFSDDRGFAGHWLSLLTGKIQVNLEGLPGLQNWLREYAGGVDPQQLLRRFNDPRGMYAHCFCTPTQGEPRR